MAFNGRGAADVTFSALNAITMTFFVVEITLNSFAKPDYFWFATTGRGIYWVALTGCGLCASYGIGFYFCGGFYFWLDVISTVSMIFDVEWINPGAEHGAGLARSARMSRLTKGARVVRLARLLRLVRIIKLFKLKAHRDERMEEDEDDEDEEIATKQPSKVAKKLTELTTRKIIILLLVMVAFFPFFDEPRASTDQGAAARVF